MSDEDSIEALRRRLRAMERDGQVIYTRRGAYAPVDKLDLIPGQNVGLFLSILYLSDGTMHDGWTRERGRWRDGTMLRLLMLGSPDLRQAPGHR